MDLRNEKLGYKIRSAQTSKVPYQLVIGDQEVETGTVNVRRYGQDASESMKVQDFIAEIRRDNENKSQTSES